MEDLSVKTKSLNPAALATAPGQSLGGADKDAAPSPADAFAAAFSQFLRKAATKPDHVLASARGQVLPFDISFGARADFGRDQAGFERTDAFAPRSDVAPTQAAPRDDRRPLAQDGGSSTPTSTPDRPERDSVATSDSATNNDRDSRAASSGHAETKGDRDANPAAARTQSVDTTDNDEHGRGRRKKSAGSATAKGSADSPKEQSVAVLTGLLAVAATEKIEISRDDDAEKQADTADDANESRRLAGIANALDQLAKQPRGLSRAGANQAEDAQQSADSGEAADATTDQDVKTAKKSESHGDARARQAADLAERIGSGTRMSVEVTVTDEAKTLISRPTTALFAARDDKGDGSSLARDGGTQADGTAEQTLTGNMIPETADDIAARFSLMAGAGAVSAAPQASAEAEGATVQLNIQGIAQGGGTAARALESSGPTSAAQNAQRPAANFRAEVLEQVSVNIQKAIKDGTDRITIQLRPAELGRIDIRIEVSGEGRTLVHVAADRPDTLDLLQRDARDLARSLQDAGLRADAGSLQFSLREQTAENRERRPRGAGPGGSVAGNGAAAEVEEIPNWTPSVRPGRVDIRA